MPLSDDVNNIFPMVADGGSFTSRHVPPEVLNVTGYFEATMVGGTSTTYDWCERMTS